MGPECDGCTHIALLVPVCSRGQTYTGIDDTPLIKEFLPAFCKTILPSERKKYEFRVLVGIDDDDAFYLDRWESLRDHTQTHFSMKATVHILTDCAHNPVRAWNRLFEHAYMAGFEYFFQVGDDVILDTPGWVSTFVHVLQQQENIGTIGPSEMNNYWGRKLAGQHIVNENNFVHRRHYDIFGYFFFPEIRNWHCDDWITLVYDEYTVTRMDVRCRNVVQGNRYTIQPCTQIDAFVKKGKRILETYLERHLNTTRNVCMQSSSS